ncbi:MAG: glycosyltransferase family 4 protein [Calditrichia bacterium]
MKICYICPSRTPHIRAYIDYFASRGHEIHIISLTKDFVPDAELHYVGAGNELKPINYFFGIPRVARVLRRVQPDICHAHWITSNGMMAAMAGASPLIVTEHGSAMQRLKNVLRKSIVNYVAGKADLINPVSPALAELMSAAGIDKGKMFVASVGVITDKFITGPRDFSARPLRLINTRAFRSLDNLDILVHALKILNDKGLEFHCTFAGPRGPEYENVKILVQRLGLSDYCSFPEGYRQKELPAILKNQHLYLTCTSFDGTSISLLEAMAAGLPVIASDIPANRNWIRNDLSGLLVQVRDAQALAGAIERLYHHPDLCVQFSGEAFKTVRIFGERDNIFAKLEEWYFTLAGMHIKRPENLPIEID